MAWAMCAAGLTRALMTVDVAGSRSSSSSRGSRGSNRGSRDSGCNMAEHHSRGRGGSRGRWGWRGPRRQGLRWQGQRATAGSNMLTSLIKGLAAMRPRKHPDHSWDTGNNLRRLQNTVRNEFAVVYAVPATMGGAKDEFPQRERATASRALHHPFF